MSTVWTWLAGGIDRDTKNHDLRTALQKLGYNERSKFEKIYCVRATLEPLLVAAPGVTVAMVGGLFAEAVAQRMFFVFLLLLCFGRIKNTQNRIVLLFLFFSFFHSFSELFFAVCVF